MDISFKNRKLEKVFNSEKELLRNYGKDNATLIKRRMAVLKAADTLIEVPTAKPERCHELAGDRKGEFSVDLKNPYRLISKPNHDPVPLKKDKGIDLTRVTAITILGVEDYH